MVVWQGTEHRSEFRLRNALSMAPLPHCPKCSSELTYELETLFACFECEHGCAHRAFGGMKLKSEFFQEA